MPSTRVITSGLLVLLARSFEASGNHARAARYYAQANEMAQYSNPDMLVAEAQARLRATPVSQATMTTVRARARAALTIAPSHPGAHYVAGDLALREGALAKAIAHFEAVYAADVLAPSAQQALQARLQEWRAMAGEPVPAETESPAIAVRVEGPVPQSPAGATLFVYARNPGGPAMPLAARRIAQPTFPVAIALRDSDRLREGPSLLSYDVLAIGARLSTTGDVTGADGDASALVQIRPESSASATLRLQY